MDHYAPNPNPTATPIRFAASVIAAVTAAVTVIVIQWRQYDAVRDPLVVLAAAVFGGLAGALALQAIAPTGWRLRVTRGEVTGLPRARRIPAGRGRVTAEGVLRRVRGARGQTQLVELYEISFEAPGSGRQALVTGRDAIRARAFAEAVAKTGGFAMRWSSTSSREVEERAPDELDLPLAERLQREPALFPHAGRPRSTALRYDQDEPGTLTLEQPAPGLLATGCLVLAAAAALTGPWLLVTRWQQIDASEGMSLVVTLLWLAAVVAAIWLAPLHGQRERWRVDRDGIHRVRTVLGLLRFSSRLPADRIESMQATGTMRKDVPAERSELLERAFAQGDAGNIERAARLASAGSPGITVARFGARQGAALAVLGDGFEWRLGGMFDRAEALWARGLIAGVLSGSASSTLPDPRKDLPIRERV